MKILWINHPEADFGGAFFYHGVCQLIGSENVFDYPRKLSYHGITHKYRTSSIADGHTAPFAWMPAHPQPPWECDAEDNEETGDAPALDQEVRQKLRDGFFDLAVMEGPREMCLSHWNKVKDVLGGIPLVVHDGEDAWQLGTEIIDGCGPELYLKREFVPDTPRTYGSAKIIPFPFSWPDTYQPQGNRDELDVAFSCGNTWNLRQDVAEAFQAHGRDLNKHIGLHPDTGGGLTNNPGLLPWDKYLDKMATAKMAVSARGFGWDTCRYWEVPFCTVMLCDNVDIEIPNPFVHKEHCLRYDNQNHCVDLVRLWKDRTEDLTEIFEKGLAHAKAHHTSKARARSMFEALEMDYAPPVS